MKKQRRIIEWAFKALNRSLFSRDEMSFTEDEQRSIYKTLNALYDFKKRIKIK